MAEKERGKKGDWVEARQFTFLATDGDKNL